ncbi:MAG TPA: DUF5615 family PIN-like protein [Pyrinomonadaceae bacterium]|nr:DUF5615 family PIN-like protein [Pyrinomonadaceae bacterium]
MKIRFQADADLKQSIVTAARRREPGLDFQLAGAAQLEGLPDPEVLTAAARDGRVLVSHDKRTLPQHFAEFVQLQPSPGVIIVPQRILIATAVEELLLIWHASTPEEWIDRIAHLPL